MSKPTPAQRLPGAAARAPARRAEVIAALVAHLRAARVREHRDPCGRAARPIAKGGEIDKELYVLRRLQADDAADDTGWASTST
jgi:histidyl-tRNA synthetase